MMKSSFLFVALALLLPFQNFAFAESSDSLFVQQVPDVQPGNQFKVLTHINPAHVDCTNDYRDVPAGKNYDVDPQGREMSARYQRCFDSDYSQSVYKIVGWRVDATGEILPYKDTTSPKIDGTASTEGTVIKECENCKKNPLRQFARLVESTVTPMAKSASSQKLPVNKNNFFNPMCKAFISPEDGSLGEIGKTLNIELDKSDYANYVDDAFNDVQGMNMVCPNYKKLSVDQKKFFWIWTFTSIGQTESTCGIKNKAPGKNDMAVGMLGLELSNKRRRDRVEAIRKFTGKYSSYNYCNDRRVVMTETRPKDMRVHIPNVLCGLDLMLGHLIGVYGAPKLTAEKNHGKQKEVGPKEKEYWAGLRGTNGKVLCLIKQLDMCGVKYKPKSCEGL